MKVSLESADLDSLENHGWKYVPDAKFDFLDISVIISKIVVEAISIQNQLIILCLFCWWGAGDRWRFIESIE